MDEISAQNGFPEPDQHNETILRAFYQYGTKRLFKKNEFIFQENDPPAAAFYVEKGLIKISQSSQEGQGITLFLRYPGEVFGNAELLANVSRKRYAKCLTDSEILTFESRQFLALAKEDPAFSYSLATITARRLLQTQNMVETLISRPVAWRLGWFLIQMGKREEGVAEVQLQLSHEEISYVIGCSRQTVTELLNKWREQALIAYDKKKIVILDPSRFLFNL
ncbi:CRP-like cAMP-binding protein [Paenibacillus endophyticus]|uniref:CRP-like cAMP-binding protein n=1 Tax=Paenibacillus endophyticus TaxID=1294268 RepID=A0A7W5C498_9BACL|nr:Crp/Fnr family transcriptional regulator [Paenibacillus endophyticus]MBB3150733.1 CRP-like cAMP-binding protein [Paenibacillus endophyticus]